jgi:hypothetical protein
MRYISKIVKFPVDLYKEYKKFITPPKHYTTPEKGMHYTMMLGFQVTTAIGLYLYLTGALF